MLYFEEDVLEATERANKTALLLVRERYDAQLGKFVGKSKVRLSYVGKQIDRMIREVCADTNADPEYVASRLDTYLAAVLDSPPPHEDLAYKTDWVGNTDEENPMGEKVKKDDVTRPSGEVEGAGLEDALNPEDGTRIDLKQGAYTAAESGDPFDESTWKTCFRCESKLNPIVAQSSPVCRKCTDELKKQSADDLSFSGDEMAEMYPNGMDEDDHATMNHMWEKDMGMRLAELEQELQTITPGSEEERAIYEEIGRLHTQMGSGHQDNDFGNPGDRYEYDERLLSSTKEAYGDEVGVENGMGTGIADPSDPTASDILPVNPTDQAKCGICEAFQGARNDVIDHIHQQHQDVLQRQQQEMTRQQPQPAPLASTRTGDTEEEPPPAKVEPLPETPVGQFDDMVQDLAEKAAAIQFSRPDPNMVHTLASQLGIDESQIQQNLVSVAIFGNYVGRNGELSEDATAPEGWEEVSNEASGGAVSQHEALIPTDTVVSKVAEQQNMNNELAYNMIRDHYGGTDLPEQFHASVNGETHLYLPTELAGNQQQEQTPQEAPVQQGYDPNTGPAAPPAPQPTM
jgi:hypothetical protein